MSSPLVELGLLPWADVPYAEQLERKHEFLRQAFARRGMAVPVEPVRPSARVVGARARVKLQSRGGRLGFFRPGTHELASAPLDDLARPEVVEAAQRIDAKDGEVELRSDGLRVVVHATARCHGLPDVAINGKVVAGDPTLRVDGLRVSPGSFYQVNLEANRALVAHVDEVVRSVTPEALLDLYGGIGNLSRAASRRGTPITVVEANAAAAADARHNLPGAVVTTGDAGKYRPGSAVFDVALLDPPRTGAPGVLVAVATTRPRAIVYVSCDPVTLARDVSSVTGGYDVVSVVPFDMFPGTDHVEVVCVLERATRTSRR